MCLLCIDCCFNVVFGVFSSIAWLITCGRSSAAENYTRFDEESGGASAPADRSRRSAMSSSETCQNRCAWISMSIIILLLLAILGISIANVVLASGAVSTSDIEHFIESHGLMKRVNFSGRLRRSADERVAMICSRFVDRDNHRPGLISAAGAARDYQPTPSQDMEEDLEHVCMYIASSLEERHEEAASAA